MPQPTMDELLNRLGRIEASIAKIELAMTRLRFALARLGGTEGTIGHAALIVTADAYRASLAVLLEHQKIALWDIERQRQTNGRSKCLTFTSDA